MKDEQRGERYDLRRRTMDFALRILRLTARIPNTQEGWVIRRQLAKSGTSPGAHYREAHRARSNAEFISKMEGGLQELDESGYWLDLLRYSKLLDTPETAELLQECEELIRIFVSCVKAAKEH
ncbi:MAG: four helix bundle protein [Phycisphaerae bacterium]|nr:four helix bundle protein [Tepidisphaeraceae bacterium]